MNFEFNLLTGFRIWVQYNRDYTCDLFISGYITPGVCTLGYITPGGVYLSAVLQCDYQ